MGKLSQKKDQNIIKQSKGLKKKSVSSEKQTLKKTKKPDQKAHSSSSKKLKKSLKANDDNSDGKEVSDSLRQELVGQDIKTQKESKIKVEYSNFSRRS